ncbi:MAG: hypothetical protein L3J56_00490 [Bacteroidales bacterium]|nr:hypothetical protein [Bacteroidales bacterium]
MLYTVEIHKPFANFYGSVKSIRLPQEIEKIKSVSLNIADLKELSDRIASLPTEVRFDLFKFSLLLNNGNDEVIADVPGQLSLFQVINDWNGGTPLAKQNDFYNMQKIVLNKKVIKNSVHYGIFKMTDDLTEYLSINSGTQQFGDYLRSDDFKLILYIEAA